MGSFFSLGVTGTASTRDEAAGELGLVAAAKEQSVGHGSLRISGG
jgi:hypothetical protein